ncbi:hypothetical protein Afil01_54800 [Actinorhabdospora filicis]|uniref:Uncharacterized protein n=1 Tax=Actinorhabdospora filicis TaxID=1785913 RepID=A0A9W6SQU9_9ACTN|nr:hypothetical protein [Actinorhabdospora filicis]GLZ80673.1 hypothetical protein Afil01_54800 [Actinorhabdospora filicis]
MALGEVVAQLVAVRGAIQTAMGLLADAGSEATEALGKAETALQGAAHELAEEGLSLWRRGETEGGFTLQKLAAADDALADYLEVLSPGSGTKSTAIAKPTGEELLKRRRSSSRTRNSVRSFIEKADQVDDAVKNITPSRKILEISHPDLPTPPPYVITETGTRGPVMRAPDTPKADYAQGAMSVVILTTVAVVTSVKAKDIATRVHDRWRNQ